jgi:type I thyroxine 5'-deiodinase
LYDTYRDRVAFYVVYIQEAHPTDLWQLPSNIKDGVLFASPRSGEERTSTAQACIRNLGIRIPAVLDHIDNRTERAYTGWPDRLFLIARGGRVVYKSAPGPYGFSPHDLERELNQLIRSSS